MSVKNHPSRDAVLRIAREEAASAGIDVAVIMDGAVQSAKVFAARARAWRRIAAETRCSTAGLATVWGADKTSVARVLNAQSLERAA